MKITITAVLCGLLSILQPAPQPSMAAVHNAVPFESMGYDYTENAKPGIQSGEWEPVHSSTDADGQTVIVYWTCDDTYVTVCYH